MRPIEVEYVKKINEQCHSDDTKTNHMRADNILCDLLLELGCLDVVEAYSRVCKWYA